MLPEFNLINMNGRLYDPQIGRFLSTDNYVQEPTNSQNFNRYSYCLNNPLKYTDPSGEWALLDDGIAMLVGGVLNLGANLLQGNVHSFWQGLSLFAVGAVSGEAALYTGGAAPFVTAAITSVGNDLVNQGFNNGTIDWEQVGTNLVMSEIMAGITCGLSGLWSGPISNFVSELDITSPALESMLSHSWFYYRWRPYSC
jgi:RHS repeat-associated protein